MEENLGRLYSLTDCEYVLFLVEDNTILQRSFQKSFAFLICVSILPVLCAFEVFL